MKDIYVTGPDNQLVPLSTIATIRDSTVPRSLNRFQQLNAIKLSGMTAQLDEGLKVLENAAREILPPGYTINYTGESRQLRTEGGKFLPALGLAIVMIFLVLAVQFNSFRDPFVILLGSVPLAMFGALIFTVLKMPNSDLPYWTNGWTTNSKRSLLRQRALRRAWHSAVGARENSAADGGTLRKLSGAG